MSVISLQCPNCNAKLKAKSSAIGQSLACPRCANMLVVSDPTANEKKERPLRSFESDSLDELLDQPNLGADLTDQNRRATPKPQHPEDFQATMPAQSASQFSDLESAPKATPNTKSNLSKPKAAVPESPASDDAKMGPAAWQSQKAKKRQAVLLGLVLGVGVLLIGGALTYYLLNQPAVTADNLSGKDGQKLPATEPDVSSEPNSNTDEETGTGRVGETNAAAESNATTESSDNPGNDPSVKDDPNSTTPVTSDPNPEGIPDLVEPGTPGTTITTDSQSDPEQNSEADPASAEDTKQAGAHSRESFEDAINQIFNGDAVFQEQTLTGPEASGNDASNSPFGEVLIAEGGLQRRRSARYERPAERLVDVAEQLTTEIAGIKNDTMQPQQLLQVMERLSSVPIWIDKDAFQSQPIDLNKQAAVQSIKQSVADVLAEHLKTFELTFEATEYGVRVFPVGAAEVQSVRYLTPGLELSTPTAGAQDDAANETQTPSEPLEDGPLGNVQPAVEPENEVAGNEVQANPVAKEITTVVQQFIHSGDWQLEGAEPVEGQSKGRSITVEGDALTVDGPAETQFRVKRLLDQLTAAQSATPDELDTGILRPIVFSCEKELSQLIRLDFYSPTPLRELLAGFTKETGIRVIVDWPALIKEGWTPDTEVPWIVENTTAGKALDELTFDMGLSYQVVSTGVIVLTSPDSINQNMDVEVYPVGDLLAGLDQWPLLRSRLSQMLYVEFKQYPNAYLNYFADWDCVIAKLPQGGHQRLTEYFSRIRTIIQQNNMANQ